MNQLRATGNRVYALKMRLYVFQQEIVMKLRIQQSQSVRTGLLGGKKYTYSLKIVAEMTNEEMALLNTYGDLVNESVIGSEVSEVLKTVKNVNGPYVATVAQLQQGLRWSCDDGVLKVFSEIPNEVLIGLHNLLGVARTRRDWDGEVVLE